MAAVTTITIKHGDEATPTITDRLVKPASDAKEAAAALAAELSGFASGARSARLSLKVEDVTTGDRASATATCATVVEDDVLTIGDVSLTAKDSPSGESEVDVGASNTIMAANFAAAINAHSGLLGIVTATSAAAVVTITSTQPGRIGEFITLAETGTTITLSASALGGVTATQYASRDHGFGVA